MGSEKECILSTETIFDRSFTQKKKKKFRSQKKSVNLKIGWSLTALSSKAGYASSSRLKTPVSYILSLKNSVP